jgi:hypothetical protein
MYPAVPLPPDSKVRIPIEVKLKPRWRYDPARRVFVSAAGETFDARGQLPKNSRIVYKVPALAAADEKGLSAPERELRRYMQVILPPGQPPSRYVEAVRAWPSVAEASAGPEVSLPRPGALPKRLG